jgi:hypothetical protein
MTSTETYSAAAARMAAAAILTAEQARKLDDNDEARLERADRIASALADCGRYAEVASAILSDEANHAVSERIEQLGRLDAAHRARRA